LVVTACGGPFTSTSSDLYVDKKTHSKDDKEAWIIAYDPNSNTEIERNKNVVQELMVWNLIKVNKSYFSSYSKKGDNPWILEQIEHLGDNATIR